MPPELDIALRVLTTLGALGGITLLLRARAEKRKVKAETTRAEIDAAAAMAGTALSLIAPLREEIAQCQVDTARLRRLVSEQAFDPPLPEGTPP